MLTILQRAFAWAIILCKMADFHNCLIFRIFGVFANAFVHGPVPELSFFPSLYLGFEPGRLKRRVQDKSHAHA